MNDAHNRHFVVSWAWSLEADTLVFITKLSEIIIWNDVHVGWRMHLVAVCHSSVVLFMCWVLCVFNVIWKEYQQQRKISEWNNSGSSVSLFGLDSSQKDATDKCHYGKKGSKLCCVYVSKELQKIEIHSGNV